MTLGTLTGIAGLGYFAMSLMEAAREPIFAFALVTSAPLLLLLVPIGFVLVRTGRRLLKRDNRTSALVALAFASSMLLALGTFWQRWNSMRLNRHLVVVGAGPDYESRIVREHAELLALGAIALIAFVALGVDGLARRRSTPIHPAALRSATSRSALLALSIAVAVTAVDLGAARAAQARVAAVQKRIDAGIGWVAPTRSIGPPAVDQGTAYVTDAGGFVHAISTRNGHELWRTRTFGTNTQAPAIGGNRVYVAGGATLTALEAKTGRQLWRITRRSDNLERAFEGQPAADGTHAYAISSENALLAVDGNTGSVSWTFWSRDVPDIFGPDPIFRVKLFDVAVADDAVIVGAEDGLRALDPATGGARWHLRTRDAIRAIPGVTGETVVAIDDSGTVYAIDIRTGTLTWKRAIEGDEWQSAVRITPDAALILGSNGLDALDLRSGRQLWRNGMHFLDVAYANGALYAASSSTVEQLDPATGEQVGCLQVHWSTISRSVVASTRGPIIARESEVLLARALALPKPVLEAARTYKLMYGSCPRASGRTY